MEIEQYFNWTVTVIIVVAFLLLATGQFLDLKIELGKSDQERATVSLLQTIIGSSPLLIKDSSGNLMKGLFDKAVLATASLSDCCNSLEYDYVFTITEDGTKKVVASNIDSKYLDYFNYDLNSQCYTFRGLSRQVAAESPVSICEKIGDCKVGKAKIVTTSSPLSELAYSIAVACNRDPGFSRLIPFSPSDTSITRNALEKEICINSNCKKYYCNDPVEFEVDKEDQQLQKKDFNVRTLSSFTCLSMRVSRESGKIVVTSPVELTEFTQPNLPASRDAWTEEESIPAYRLSVSGDIRKSNPSPELLGSRASILFANINENTYKIYLDLTKLGVDSIDLSDFKTVSFSIKADKTSDLWGVALWSSTDTSSRLGYPEDRCLIRTFSYTPSNDWQDVTFQLKDNIGGLTCPKTVNFADVKVIEIFVGRTGANNAWIDNLYFSKK